MPVTKKAVVNAMRLTQPKKEICNIAVHQLTIKMDREVDTVPMAQFDLMSALRDVAQLKINNHEVLHGRDVIAWWYHLRTSFDVN